MSVKGFFANTIETRELHPNPQLRTNYYRNNYKQIIEALEKLAEDLGLKIKNVDEIHKEIYMITSNYDIIFTLAQITPSEYGIDLKINWFSGFGFNRPKKKAAEIFAKLKELLRFKGVSLHP